MKPRDRRTLAALVIATLAFAASMRLREALNPWLMTTAAALIAIAAALAARPRLVAQVRRWSARGAMLSAALGVALVLATHAAYRLAVALVAPALSPHVDSLYTSIDVFPGAHRAAPLILVVVLAEELIWRGLVVDWLLPRFGWRVAAIASVTISAVPQIIGGTWILVAAAVVLGTIFVTQRLHTGRLTDPLITHAIWSLSVFSLFPL